MILGKEEENTSIENSSSKQELEKRGLKYNKLISKYSLIKLKYHRK